jgi:hypothetical protein
MDIVYNILKRCLIMCSVQSSGGDLNVPYIQFYRAENGSLPIAVYPWKT